MHKETKIEILKKLFKHFENLKIVSNRIKCNTNLDLSRSHYIEIDVPGNYFYFSLKFKLNQNSYIANFVYYGKKLEWHGILCPILLSTVECLKK